MNKDELWKTLTEPIKSCENCSGSIYNVCVVSILDLENTTCNGVDNFSGWKYEDD